MEIKDSYRPDEIAKMLVTHYFIAGELGSLEAKMTETKNRLYETKDKGDVDKLWGHLIRNRYEEVRQAYREAYEEAIPKNVRDAFEREGILPDLSKRKN